MVSPGSSGADFYQELVEDPAKDGIKTDFYQQTGVYLLKKKEEKLEELYQLALSRREESPLIGDLAILTKEEVAQQFPGLQGFEKLLFCLRWSPCEGALLTETLLKASGARVIKEEVALAITDDGYQIAEESYDQVILATGAWLGQMLQPLGYQVDVRPQRGNCGIIS